MKIVINIPEQIYTDIKCGITNGSYDMWLAVAEGQPLSEVIDKISAEIKEKAFTEEIFDEDVFNSTYTEGVSRETAECESIIETEIVKLSDILEIIEKYKGVR